ISSGVRKVPAAPPISTACSVPCTPWQCSSSTVRRGTPNGISYTPVWLTCPLTETSLVPVLCWLPHCRNHSAPCRITPGTTHNVSTLLTTVGLLNSPCVVGYGGLMRGNPRL